MKSAGCLAFVALTAIAGCRTYEPSPIDWMREKSVWMERGELKFASLDDVERIALVGNAELNLMRVKRSLAANVVREIGWWDDPELDIDLMRVVNPTENPVLGGASLSMTLPLSGVKGLERKAADCYLAADAADIVAAERETAVAVRMAALRYLTGCESVRIQRDFESDTRVVEALAAAERLAEAGELSKTEVASARLRRHQRLHKLRESEYGVAESEQELRRLMGVAPSVRLDFDGYADRPRSPAATALDPLDCTRHPKVRAAVCRLEGGEAALEAEIRRQYPDLKLGPAYSREEGLDRFGIVAGLTLPLWNRNRKGIAEAEGKRDEAKAEAVRIWRDIVLAADAARRTLMRLKDHPPETPPNAVAANALVDAGEMGALEYLVLREEALEAELMERDWRRDVRLAEENLKHFETEEK